jgi:hypothetical protein
MAEPKTKPTTVNVHDFINGFADTPQKRQDSFDLIALMQEVTGYEPIMWGPSIIGLALTIISLKEAARKAIGCLLDFHHARLRSHLMYTLQAKSKMRC